MDQTQDLRASATADVPTSIPRSSRGQVGDAASRASKLLARALAAKEATGKAMAKPVVQEATYVPSGFQPRERSDPQELSQRGVSPETQPCQS